MSSSLAVTPALRRSSLPLSRSLLFAVLIEGALLLGAAGLIVSAKSAVTAEQPVTLVFDDAPPAPPKQEEPKPEPPKPLEKPTPVKRAVVLPRPALPPQPPVAQPTPTPEPAPALSPIAEPAAPSAPPPAQEPAHASDAAQKEANFAARLRAAIQAAVVYPFAARTMGAQGKARVEFVFRDGAFSHVRIIQSSGNGMLDQAALAAVTHAAVPPIPDSLAGKSMTYQVTVVFELNAG
jgi:protein TonB